jgi:hypothetical protein
VLRYIAVIRVSGVTATARQSNFFTGAGLRPNPCRDEFFTFRKGLTRFGAKAQGSPPNVLIPTNIPDYLPPTTAILAFWLGSSIWEARGRSQGIQSSSWKMSR